MDAIILAAGRGTRLRPHTDTCPKPLLPVQGKPIIEWIMAALPKVDRVCIVVNHLAGQFEEFLERQSLVRKWTVVRQTVPRGTGDALMSCKGKLQSDRVMVLNGDDIIGRADLAKLAEVPMGILAHPVQTPDQFGILFRKPDGTLEKIIEKPQGLTPPQLANIGGYIFPSEVFDLTLPLSPRGEYEITDAVSQLAAKHPFHVVEAGFWLPIGTVDAWNASQTADLSPA